MAEVALLAGIVASDGHLEKDRRGIKVITTSKLFLDEVVLPLLSKVSGKVPSVYKGRTGFSNRQKYVAYLYDEFLSSKLRSDFAIPMGKKSAIIKPPQVMTQAEVISYIQGWFAGEGSASLDVHFKNGRRYSTAQIMLWVKNEFISAWLFQVLNSLGIKAKLFHSVKREQFLVIIRERASVFLFKDKIGFVHPEKREKLELLLRDPQNQNVARQFGGIS